MVVHTQQPPLPQQQSQEQQTGQPVPDKPSGVSSLPRTQLDLTRCPPVGGEEISECWSRLSGQQWGNSGWAGSGASHTRKRSLPSLWRNWPNPTVSLLKERGRSSPALKEAVIYNFLLTCIWGREQGARERDCMVSSFLLISSSQMQLQRKS